MLGDVSGAKRRYLVARMLRMMPPTTRTIANRVPVGLLRTAWGMWVGGIVTGMWWIQNLSLAEIVR